MARRTSAATQPRSIEAVSSIQASVAHRRRPDHPWAGPQGRLEATIAPVGVDAGPAGDLVEPRTQLAGRIEAIRRPPRLEQGLLDGFRRLIPVAAASTGRWCGSRSRSAGRPRAWRPRRRRGSVRRERSRRPRRGWWPCRHLADSCPPRESVATTHCGRGPPPSLGSTARGNAMEVVGWKDSKAVEKQGGFRLDDPPAGVRRPPSHLQRQRGGVPRPPSATARATASAMPAGATPPSGPSSCRASPTARRGMANGSGTGHGYRRLDDLRRA